MHFSPSCTATLSVFIGGNIPMFHAKQPANVGRDFKEERTDNMFAALVRFIQEWKRYNQSLNELSRLGDRELADIGISRSDIARVAWNSAHRD
jgi:uncharacterized protein YjiS (DUF1127 family)